MLDGKSTTFGLRHQKWSKTLAKLRHHHSKKKGRKNCWKLRERKSKSLTFLKTNTADEPELSVQSKDTDPEQYRVE